VPTLVLTEVVHFLGDRLGPEIEVRFLRNLAEGRILAEPVHASDWLRIAELVWTYRDLSLGSVDASVIAAAERLSITSLATLDRRHFSVVRPSHAPGFDLLP
jgi:predicted nucleic acid-binding protein